MTSVKRSIRKIRVSKKEIYKQLQKERQVLVLNSYYMPLDVITWKDAIIDVINGVAEITDTYENIIISSSTNRVTGKQYKINCPSVIRLKNVSRNPYKYMNILPLTRQNILEVDGCRCAYCGIPLRLSNVTVDHVVPVSQGGLSDWLNLRASCFPCNNKKGDKLLSETNLKLRSRKQEPIFNGKVPRNIVVKIGGKVAHESWKKYITWSTFTE